jgi:hypothetical protein
VFQVNTAFGEIAGGGDAWTAGADDDKSSPTSDAANTPERTIAALILKPVLRILSSSGLETALPRMDAKEIAALSRSLDGGAEVRLRHR